MKKLILVSFIIFLLSCSSDDPKPTTYQIVNNMELDKDPAFQYLDGSMWEVTVFCFDIEGDIVREDYFDSIIAGGGRTTAKEVTDNIVKLVVSFKFLPKQSPYYDFDTNERNYTVTRFVIVPETNNVFEITGKTKDEKPRIARIPLSEKAKTILSKYDLPGDELLPFISSQKYNDYIKDLFSAVKLNRIVTVRDPKTGIGKQLPISEIASSHMARRVFVGGLYGKGVKNEIIASMSGHAQDSKSFARYFTIEKQNQIDAMKLIE